MCMCVMNSLCAFRSSGGAASGAGETAAPRGEA